MSEDAGSIFLGLKVDSSNLANEIKTAGDKASKSSGGGLMSKIFGSKSSDTVSGAINKVKTAAVGLGATIGGGAGLFALANSAVEAGNKVYELSSKMHLSAADAGLLNRELTLSGTDSQTFISAMTKLDKTVNSGKSNVATKEMEKYGVSIKDASGKLLPMNDQLAQLASGYQKAAAAGDEEAYTSQVLGTKGIALTEILSHYKETAEEAGKVKGIGIDSKQAHEAAIQMQALKMQMSVFGQVAGAAVLPIITKITPVLMSGISDVANLIKEEQPQIKSTITTIADILQSFVVPLIKGVFDFIGTHGPLIKATIIGIGAAFAVWKTMSVITTVVNGIKAFQEATKAATVVQWLFDAAADANPIGILVVVIAAIVAAIAIFIANNKGAQKVLLSVWGGIVGFFKGLWAKVSKIFAGVWPVISGIVKTYFGVIQGVFKTGFDYITNVFKFFKDLFTGNWKDLGKDLHNIVDGLIKDVLNIFKGLFKGIKNVFGNIVSTATKWGGDMINGIANGIKGAASAVGNAVSGVANNIKNFLHFSRPDKGPLVEYESWMPDMLKSMAKGVLNNQGVLTGAIQQVATGAANILHPQSMRTAYTFSGASSLAGKSGHQVIEHKGTIKVTGVNNKGEFVGAAEYILDELRKEGRR